MPELRGFQLLPQTKKGLAAKEPSENRFVILAAALSAIVLALFLVGTLYASTLNKKIGNINQDIIELEKQRNPQAEKKLAVLSKQARQMSAVLDNHVFWTKALSIFSRLLQSQTQVKSFNAALSSNTLEFNGLVANYTVLAKQIAAFRSNNAIDDIALGEVHSTISGRLEFSMKILFKPDKFLKND